MPKSAELKRYSVCFPAHCNQSLPEVVPVFNIEAPTRHCAEATKLGFRSRHVNRTLILHEVSKAAHRLSMKLIHPRLADAEELSDFFKS